MSHLHRALGILLLPSLTTSRLSAPSSLFLFTSSSPSIHALLGKASQGAVLGPDLYFPQLEEKTVYNGKVWNVQALSVKSRNVLETEFSAFHVARAATMP